MCLAIFRPAGTTRRITRQELENSRAVNQDGFGVLWAQDNTLKLWKSIRGKLWPQFLDVVDSLQEADVPMAIHLRMATHGAVTWQNAHPIEVIPGQLGLIHNGVLSDFSKKKNESDTREFAKFLQTLPTNWQASKPIMFLLEEYVGYSNKVVLLQFDGSYRILGENNGYWQKGVWFSNRSHETCSVKKKDKRSSTDGKEAGTGTVVRQFGPYSDPVQPIRPLVEEFTQEANRPVLWTPSGPYRFSADGFSVFVCKNCVKLVEEGLGIGRGVPVLTRKIDDIECEYCHGDLWTTDVS